MKPNINYTNTFYGGNKPNGNNIVYINGLLDPWHILSVLRQPTCCDTLVPIISNDTSHCADLASPRTTDPISLIEARYKVTELLQQWTNINDLRQIQHRLTEKN